MPACLRTTAYAGRLIYHRKRTRGKTTDRWGPHRTPKRREGTVSREVFQRAQAHMA